MHSRSGASALQRTSSGAASAAAPRVRPTLVMLLPTALPSASAGLPVNTARALTARSGTEVPKATRSKHATDGHTTMRHDSHEDPRPNDTTTPRTDTHRTSQRSGKDRHT